MSNAEAVQMRAQLRRIASTINGIDRRLSAFERSSQLEFASLLDKDGNTMDVQEGVRAGLDALADVSGKGTVYYNESTDPPVSPTTGDLWLVKDQGYRPRAWNGTQWVDLTFGGTAIGDGAVSTPKIAADAIVSSLIAAGAVTADKLAAVLVLASQIIAGTQGGARVQIDATGVHAYDADGTETVAVNSDGTASFTGDIDGSTISGSLVQTADPGSVRVEIGSVDDPSDADQVRFYADTGATPSAVLTPYSGAAPWRPGSVNKTGITVDVNGETQFAVTEDGPYTPSAINFAGGAIDGQVVSPLTGREEVVMYTAGKFGVTPELHFGPLYDGTAVGMYGVLAGEATGIGIFGNKTPQYELQVRVAGTGAYQNIRASTFSQSSSEVHKVNIEPAPSTALQQVLATPIKRFQRTSDVDELGETDAPWHIGPLAEQAPECCVNGTGDDLGVSLGSMIGLLWAAVQELAEKADGTGAES